jgi:hypothetical protein
VKTPAVRVLWPTVGPEIEPGRDGYAPRATIQQYAAKVGFSRAWMVKGEIVSLQKRDGSYLKSLDNFGDHQEPDAFYTMLEECFSKQCFRPTAYHDPVYSVVEMPRVPWSVNALFVPQFAGGWNDALQRGFFGGMHRVYDIQSAYLSALAYGLPDPATYRYCRDPKRAGLLVVDHIPRAGAPYPFNIFPRVNATPDEIEIYDLAVTRIVGGVSWSRDWRAMTIADAITNFTFWKQAARAYWGRWGMCERVEMVGGNTGQVTPMRSIFTNMPWAHLILSRIRMRLAREVLGVGDVRHVFTDSIITTGTRKTHDKLIGAWKLVKEYPEGIRIEGPGKYGPWTGPLDKWAGMPIANRGNNT